MSRFLWPCCAAGPVAAVCAKRAAVAPGGVPDYSPLLKNTAQQILTDGHNENDVIAKKPLFKSLDSASWMIGTEAWIYIQIHHHHQFAKFRSLLTFTENWDIKNNLLQPTQAFSATLFRFLPVKC